MHYLTKRPLAAVYDTETTGLTKHFNCPLSEQPRIIEFGGLLTDGIEIVDTLEFIVNPGIAIEEIITKITGLTNADLDTKPYFDEYIETIAEFFGRSEIIIAHNLSFDKAMMKYDLQRMELELSDVNWPRVEICTVEQTFQRFGRRMRLEELYRMYCGPYIQKHRALDDVRLLHEMAGKIGVYTALGLETLYVD
ncbi:3'-5' exonuclease [Citrobacter sp.]|uniref:3'-5' exonuclease n=1 Tax=Citrobacter sp. TaxID=1896336 RepID=UPI002FC6B555